MLIADFDYVLPQELIARYPTQDRRGSRLLVVGQGIGDFGFADLPSQLRCGDLLVFNDTRVIKARLQARKETGGRAELLIERIENPELSPEKRAFSGTLIRGGSARLQSEES